jgi:hypothetical protein
MNFFQQQLSSYLTDRRVFAPSKVTFAGRAAFISLTGNRRARVEFVTTGIADHYDAIRVKLLNTQEGVIDQQLFRFEDYFSPMPLGGPNAQVPHIWTYRGEPEWYRKPDSADRSALQVDIRDYIQVFA